MSPVLKPQSHFTIAFRLSFDFNSASAIALGMAACNAFHWFISMQIRRTQTDHINDAKTRFEGGNYRTAFSKHTVTLYNTVTQTCAMPLREFSTNFRFSVVVLITHIWTNIEAPSYNTTIFYITRKCIETPHTQLFLLHVFATRNLYTQQYERVIAAEFLHVQ